MRLTYSIVADRVTVMARHAARAGSDKDTCQMVAQFRFHQDSGEWSLYWADRNGDWHGYEDLAPTKDFDALLEEVGEAPAAIVWG